MKIPPTLNRSRSLFCIPALLLLMAGNAWTDERLDYGAADPELKVVRLDSSETESFLSVRGDAAGRMFVGGREALFVYEPNEEGGYHPRQELYRFPDHSWVYDIEIRGRDLYVLTMNALYVIPEGVVKRDSLQPKRLVWGVPEGHVHQCFHGLAWGPEGYLYLSMGDPLWYYGDFNRPDHWGHWTFFSRPDGTKTPYTGVGAVFRCRPDGSRFEVVARGLRNSCGLAFDSQWNLFSNDNDHEGMPHDYVPGRLVHVTPQSDFCWPRGWMVHKTPDRADLLQTMFDGMGRAVPVGQSYYNETFLPEKYRNNLLLARWGTREVTRYPLKPRGASFETEEFPLLEGQNQARPVGVSVGRGGRVFANISYMAHNEGSPVYQSDFLMITRADDPDSHPFEGYDIGQADTERLWRELSNRSWWPRQRVHVELLRRGEAVLKQAAARLEAAAVDDPAFSHLIWLAAAAGQGTEDGSLRQEVVKRLAALSRHENNAVRFQAVRALSEFYADREESQALFVRALQDSDPQVRHAAVIALFDISGEIPDEVIAGPARSDDSYLRQAACRLLAERASFEQLEQLCTAGDEKTRLAGALAAGFRLTVPSADEPIPEHLPLQPWRSEEVYEVQYAEETVDLRELGRIGLFTTAEHWNAGPRSDGQERLFALLRAQLSDSSEQVRLQAAHFLYMLNDERTEPEIARVRRASEQSRLATARMHRVGEAWVAGPFPDGENGFEAAHPPEQSAIDVSAEYIAGEQTIGWQKMTKSNSRLYDFSRQFGSCDHSSFYAYCRLESPVRQQILLLLGSDDGVKAWHNGREVWTNDVSRAALPYQDAIFVELQPGSNDLLVRVRNRTGDCGLYFHFRSLGDVAIHLPEPVGVAGLAERLRAATSGSGPEKIDEQFLTVDWAEAAKQGDPENGARLFSADGIGCAKCHAIRDDAPVDGGPSLAGAGKRFTVAHLVESILLPSKQVSPVFRATLVVTTEGKTHSGLVLSETGEKLELLQADATRLTIPQAEIEERKLQDVSPMPPGLVENPEELRDLLAFLLSQSS